MLTVVTGGSRRGNSHVMWKMMSTKEENSQSIDTVTQQGKGMYKADHAIPRLINETVEMTEDMEQDPFKIQMN